MASIQPQFEKFNDTIRLGRFEENETLREKRDILRKRLKEKLPEIFEEHDEACPEFYFLDQGSYDMDTGVKPINGDFDIDQGLFFEISIDAYPDPVVLKERVLEALDGHTKSVCMQRSCVTVLYQCEGEPIYHVDIAIFSDAAYNLDGKPRTAKGKQHSKPEHRVWVISDPQLLSDTIFARFTGEGRKQFRRIIRYLKRWRDINFPSGGNGAPNGIGLTIASYDRFQPAYADPIANTHNDLRAMRMLVEDTLSRFALVWDADQQQFVRRLVLSLPVEPGTDLFGKMTGAQMAVFEQKLTKLCDALKYAEGISNPTAACERLRTVFGTDFPEVTKQESASTHPPAIVSSGDSA